MRIFDFHIHVGEDTGAAEVCSFLDRMGMDQGALLATDHGPMGGEWGTNVSNASVARIAAESNGRLHGIASVFPSDRDAAAREFEAALKMGLKGLKLYPHSGFYPDDKRLDDVYDLARQYDVPVLVHTGIKALAAHRMRFNNPLALDEVAVRFPGLKLVIMHAGYPWLREALVVARLNENIWMDMTFLDVLEYSFEEGLLMRVLKRSLKVLGSHRIVWGSEGEWLGLDCYEDEGPLRVEKMLNQIMGFSFLSAEEKQRILFDNTAALLKIDTGKSPDSFPTQMDDRQRH